MNTQRQSFDMSLRLWSDQQPLQPLLALSAFTAHRLHVKGQASDRNGPLANRIARRHYASVAHSETATAAGIEPWLSALLNALARAERLEQGIRDGGIEAVVWISVLGSNPREMPGLPSDLIARAVELGARILVENYTHLDEVAPFPEQIWLSKPYEAEK